MNQHVTDLTSGNILRKLLAVAIPIMGTSLMQMAYNLTDMFWLGQGVSSAAVAASGAAGMYLWLSMALLLVGRLGAEIGVSQNIGRGDLPAAKRFAHNAIFLAAALGLGYGLSMVVFKRPLIALFGIGEAELAGTAVDYLSIVGLGIPFTYISAAITGAFNASGNSRLSFWANFIGLILNMLLDPLMIIVFGWGINGAAIATVLAQAVVCMLFLFYLKRHRARPFATFEFLRRPDKACCAQIFRWSLPTGLESGLFTLLAMVTTRQVASFGTDPITVQRIGSQIESLSWLIGGGFGTAVTSFVGQNYGARKWSRIHQGTRIATRAMLIYGVAVAAVLFFGGKLLYAVFVPEEHIQLLGVDYLRILAACEVFACLEGMSGGAFRGLGKTLPPAAISIASNVLRVPLAYVLAATPLGLNGIWWAVSITCAMRGAGMFLWYKLRERELPTRDEAPVIEPAQ